MIVAHLDLDAFFAAVEELENPELRTKPLVVGGDPRGRGVVATANYEARRFGIHSAMSCAEALRRCPHAVFLRPRHSVYREYSQSVWSTVRGVVPTVERTGIDEGYLAVDEVAADFLQGRKVAEAVQTAVRAATSLTCSLGVSTSKVVAKVASDCRKPAGLTVVPAGGEADFLAPFAVRRLPGSGRRPRSASRPSASRRSAALPRSLMRSSIVCSPEAWAASSATGPAESTPGNSSCRASGSRSASRTPSSGTSPTGRSSTPSCCGWRSAWPKC